MWTEAYDAHDGVRDGAWVAELTHLMDLTSWPAGMCVIVRKERPHPGAQLRFGDVDGMRITAFVTNTKAGGPGTQLPGGRRGKSVLVRIDGAGSTHKVIDWLTRRRLSYSVGFTLPDNTPDLLRRIPEHVWTEAYDAVDAVRDGARVAELTDLMDLSPGRRACA